MTQQNFDALIKATVIDSDGDKVGSVGQLFLDDETQQPSFVTVKTGLFGTNETFIPLDKATVTEDEIKVPYTKDYIKDAPHSDVDQHLTPAEEADLYRYYGITGHGTAAGTETATTGTESAGYATGAAAGTAAGVASTDRAEDRDLAARRDENLDDGGIVRHEERLNVGKEQVESGRARLRKYVVTDTEQVSVPLEHEELVVERQPLKDGEVTGGTLSEGETEVVLHEERPVVDKEVVGVEKVNIGKKNVVENQTVQADVSREEIRVEQGVEGTREGFDKK